MLHLIKNNPSQMRNLFISRSSPILAANKFIGLFRAIYSPMGASKREKEAINMNWQDFVNDVANGEISTLS